MARAPRNGACTVRVRVHTQWCTPYLYCMPLVRNTLLKTPPSVTDYMHPTIRNDVRSPALVVGTSGAWVARARCAWNCDQTMVHPQPEAHGVGRIGQTQSICNPT